jgi:hypothetical protein
MLSAISANVSVTSEQRVVRQDDLVVLFEVKAITLNRDNARSFEIALFTVALNSASVSSNYITQ